MKQPIPSNSPAPIKAGDRVQIVPEWQDPGDDKYRCFDIEATDDCTIVRILTLIPGFFTQPTEWIEAAKVILFPPSNNSSPITSNIIPHHEHHHQGQGPPH